MKGTSAPPPETAAEAAARRAAEFQRLTNPDPGDVAAATATLAQKIVLMGRIARGEVAPDPWSGPP